MPDVDVDKFRTSLLSLKDTVKGKVGEVEMDPALKAAGWDKYQEFRGWFDKRLDSAIQAAIEEGRQEEDSSDRQLINNFYGMKLTCLHLHQFRIWGH